MRLRVWSFLLLFLCFVFPAISYAEEPIQIYIDNEPLDPEYSPHVIEGRTFVPIRVIAEKWGAVVGWNQQLQQVRIQKDRLMIDLFIDQHEAIVNRESVYSDAAPIVIEGKTMVPLRFVGELLGATIGYNHENHAVYVTLPLEPVDYSPDSDDEHSEQQEDQESQEDESVVLKDIWVEGNRVIIQTDGEADFEDFYLKQPERVVIDFANGSYHIQNESHQYDQETNQGIVPVNGSFIQSVRYGMNNLEQPVARVVIDLNTRGDYQITRNVEENQWIVTVEPGIYKVVIDAGHGGEDPGAIGYTGKSEKWFNLSVAKKIANLLEEEPRIQPYLTRATDEFITLEKRAAFANEIDADLFMSIHANAYLESTRGTETYYYHSYSKAFGEVVHRYLVEATGFPDRKLQKAGFYVIKNTEMPAVLTETGFLTNPTEEELLFQDEFQNKIAEALAQSIIEYLNLQ